MTGCSPQHTCCCVVLPVLVLQAGGLQRLYDCGERLQVQASKDCVNKTIARIKQKLERDDKRVLNHVIYTLRSSNREVQQVGGGATATERWGCSAVSTLHNAQVTQCA